MFLVQCPGWEIFINREDETRVRRLFIEQGFYFNALFALLRDQGFHLSNRIFLGLTEGHTPVDIDNSFIRHSVDAGSFNSHIRDSDLAMTQEGVVPQAGFQITDTCDHRDEQIDGIDTDMIAGGMCRNTFGSYLELDPTLVSTIDLHLGWFADDHKVRSDARVNFNEGIGCDAITPFFHIAKIPGSPTIQ